MRQSPIWIGRHSAESVLPEWRDIAVFLDESPAGDRIGRHAARLAQAHKAHLIGIHGVLRRLHPSDAVARGMALKQLLDRRREEDERRAAQAGRHFADMVLEHRIGSEFRIVWHGGETDGAALRSLHCDLILTAHPRLPGLPAAWSGEKLLMDTGTPVLVIPDDWPERPIGRRLLIAWNRSREARRAVNDAMPFICAADEATLVVIDRAGQGGDDSAAGTNMFDHLSRHGARVRILEVESGGRPVAQVLADTAREQGADLVVLGAYSRPRAQELIFGGTTRTLLTNPMMPLFISR